MTRIAFGIDLPRFFGPALVSADWLSGGVDAKATGWKIPPPKGTATLQDLGYRANLSIIMSAGERHSVDQLTHLDPGYRRALVVSAALNAAMFFVEGGVGLWIGSSALLADAVDFLEDAGIYSLAVIALA